ncbi:hypothetical protein JCM5805K_1449 [Lactococcus lactis subsp. lactis]|uniref:Uncharacterized protein n=1 Tax=Lactococcus lactis subsp. lactis TaxID=1360 RepID=A0A0B8QZI1_LACLL|nr:hypothetical protein JCM5805K_1449 [Lactococcus lactis subsp. lactis]
MIISATKSRPAKPRATPRIPAPARIFATGIPMTPRTVYI